MCVCACVCVCVWHMYTHTHTHIYTYMYGSVYTQKHTSFGFWSIKTWTNGEGNGNPLQYSSCLEKSMDRGVWWAESMGLHDWACVHKGGGRWVGSNEVVELKKKKKKHEPNTVFSVIICKKVVKKNMIYICTTQNIILQIFTKHSMLCLYNLSKVNIDTLFGSALIT